MNREAVQALRDKLVAERDNHAQETWASVKLDAETARLLSERYDNGSTRPLKVSCATAACAAGHTCLMAGDVFLVDPMGEFDPGEIVEVDSVETPDGVTRTVEARAQELLGLTRTEANNLFDPHHSHEQTIHLLDQLLADEDIEDYCSENCYDRDD
ncbi:hypothetical protein PBI_CJW1_96 [Mycobacterium phage Cjw1]|uniref:RDF protein n=1 Tax=Mycobacterium phage Cjw1 TaxID=2907830 RepID=Q857R5_9CAUD|nr:gp97 [Mycobacterium phage Cjw1]AAN01711.1 hypothetical protein PBI_CJW1_96 [Mycobacterium phage Cjw1]